MSRPRPPLLPYGVRSGLRVLVRASAEPESQEQAGGEQQCDRRSLGVAREVERDDAGKAHEEQND